MYKRTNESQEEIKAQAPQNDAEKEPNGKETIVAPPQHCTSAMARGAFWTFSGFLPYVT
jgi:hypothetical protein